MDVPNTFSDWVVKQVESIQDEFPVLDTRHAFAAWAVSFIHEIDKELAVDLTDTEAQGDRGIDGRYYDERQGVFYLYQAYFPDQITENIGPTKTRELFGGFELLLDNAASFRHSEKMGHISNELLSAIDDDEATVSLNCVVFGEVTSSAKQEFTDRCNGHILSPSPEITGIKRLYELDVMRTTIDELKNVTVIIPVENESFFFVAAPTTSAGIGQSAVVNFNAKKFIETIEPHSPRIFAPNVRYHLGYQNRVNKKITDTLRNPIEKHHFWHYNNGITIVAHEIKYNEDTQSISLKNPGIVNGAQTISTLINNSRFIENDIQLLARIVTLNSSPQGREKRKDIASATNRQSPVNPFDLHSNDQVQKEIQANFDRLTPSWHYQRKRGEWNSLSRSKVSRYVNGTIKRRAEMVSIAQSFRAYQGHPVDAIDEREKLFETDSIYKDIFNRTYDVRNYILAQRLFNLFDSYVKFSNQDEIIRITGSFSEATLNRLLRAKKLVVAHCVSLSASILYARYGLIDGDTALKIVEYIDTNHSSFRDNLIKIILVNIAQFSEDGEASQNDIRLVFRDTNTLGKLQTRVLRYLQSISSLAPISSLFVDL
nr:AIPR family protein [uncultured Methanoregula sp.]